MEKLLSGLGNHLFLIFGLLAVFGGASLVLARNAVHSVIGFLLAMLAIAGCYLCLSAEFLAVAQILVYAGGIVVLFLFVVMLVELTKYKERGLFQTQSPFALGAVALGFVVFAGMFWKLIFGAPAAQALTLKPEVAQGLDLARDNAQAISRGVFTEYLLPFEILSVILLVALVGAVVLAKKERV